MEHKHIVASVTVLALIIVGMFTFAYLKRAEIREAEAPAPTPTVESDSPYAGITRIDAKHFFDGKTHTIVGEIPMPTPCDLLNWSTRIQESMPETAIVDFDVINTAETCVQVVTPQRFKVSFDASEGAGIRATLEGRTIEVNLIPALPGESPDDFEIFIKG
jgi:hypothetical protein